MKPRLDHIVIGAHTLAQGVAYVKEILGVEMPFAGVHPQMGTHNHLMQLGRDVFLEVIAINPESDITAGPRWYGLDDPFVRRRIERQPTLLTWVVNTTDIHDLLQRAAIAFGKPQRIHRGALSWDFGVTDDGRMIAGGLLPYVIQWHTGFHPASKMADLGCRLQALEIYHPLPQWIEAVLASIDAADLVTIHSLPKDATPCLIAHLETPRGIIRLKSSGGMLP